MIVHKNKTLTDLDGNCFKGSNGQDLTLGDVLILALLNAKAEGPAPGDEKDKRWKLAQKIRAETADDIDLDVTDVAKIKDLIGEVCSTAVAGPARAALDPHE